MSLIFVPDARDIQLAHFTSMCTFTGIETAIIEAMGRCTQEWLDTPWWRWRKRRDLDREQDQLWRLLDVISTHRQEQEAAAP